MRGDFLPTEPAFVMTWDGYVTLTGFNGRLAKLSPGLAGHPVAEIARGSCELATGDVARKSPGSGAADDPSA